MFLAIFLAGLVSGIALTLVYCACCIERDRDEARAGFDPNGEG